MTEAQTLPTEWADDIIPTDTPDEGSIAEGGDSSTIGHGAAGGGQDSERQDGSDTVRLWACYTNGYNPSSSPVSHPSSATDPEPHPSLTLAVPPEFVFERYGPSTYRASRRGRSETIGERDAYLPSMLTLPTPSFSPNDAALASAIVSLSMHNTLADLAERVDSIALSDEHAPAPRGGGPRPPGGPFGALQGGTLPGRPAFPVPVLPNQPRRQRELPPH